jgi:hypothetical protein
MRKYWWDAAGSCTYHESWAVPTKDGHKMTLRWHNADGLSPLKDGLIDVYKYGRSKLTIGEVLGRLGLLHGQLEVHCYSNLRSTRVNLKDSAICYDTVDLIPASQTHQARRTTQRACRTVPWLGVTATGHLLKVHLETSAYVVCKMVLLLDMAGRTDLTMHHIVCTQLQEDAADVALISDGALIPMSARVMDHVHVVIIPNTPADIQRYITRRAHK